ncbi:MAG: hypothetical protein QOD29_5371, partial [Alphaproteobacteria bacterium]|nr:hypothetical protein [Alphaproteobacteria bacterium]
LDSVFNMTKPVVLGWLWSYFTFDVGVRLITGDGPSRGGAAVAGEPPE